MFSRLASGLAQNLASDIAGGASPQSILGSNLVEYWDSTAGVGLVSGEVDTWTGQKLGIILSAAAAGNRPAYGADSTYFAGKSVVQSAVTGSKYLRNLDYGSDIVPGGAASNPWICTIARHSSTPAVAYPRIMQIGRAATSADAISTYFTPPTAKPSTFVRTSAPASAFAVSASAGNLLPRMFESWSALGANTRTNMGATVNAAGVAGITSEWAVRSVSIGALATGTEVGDFSVRAAMICAAKPTEAEITALYVYFRSDSGF